MSLYDRDWYREEARQRRREGAGGERSARERRAASAFEQCAKQDQAIRNRSRYDLGLFRWVAFWVLLLLAASLVLQWAYENRGRVVAAGHSPAGSGTPERGQRQTTSPEEGINPSPPTVPRRLLIDPSSPLGLSSPKPVVQHAELALSPQVNGNFLAQGKINGRAVRFLIDTGASFVTVPERLKGALGLSRGTYFKVRTANGVVGNYATRIEHLSIGPLALREVPGALNPHDSDETVLLGMSALRGFELIQIQGQLILRQPADNAKQAVEVSAGSVPVLGMPLFKRPLSACMRSDKLVDDRVLACMEGR